MREKIFWLLFIFIIVPTLVGIDIYLSKIFHFGPKGFVHFLLITTSIIIIPTFIYFNKKLERSIIDLSRYTGLKYVRKYEKEEEKILYAEGKYKGIYWKIEKKYIYDSSKHRLVSSDQIIIKAQKSESSVNLDLTKKLLKSHKKAREIKDTPRYIEVIIFQTNVKSYRDMLEIMDDIAISFGR